MGQNHNASWNLLKVVKPLGLHGKPIDWVKLAAACGCTMKDLCAWPGAPKGVCMKYACGECLDPNCEANHAQHFELPTGWLASAIKTIKRGVAKM